MRKIIYALAVFFLLTGITITREDIPVKAQIDFSRVTEYSLEDCGVNEYAYDSLTETEKRIYMLVGEKVEGFWQENKNLDVDAEGSAIRVEFSNEEGENIPMDILNTVATRFLYSNPRYYWLEGGYHASNPSKGKYVITLRVDPYFYSADHRSKVEASLEKLLPGWVERIENRKYESGEFYAALLAHDLIIENIDYANNSSGNPESAVWAHSIAGVFTGQGAVCEGYAKAFEYLLNLAGIPNIYIIGDGNGDSHAWNAVRAENEWHLCDITWDDPNEDSVQGLNDADYTYFFMPSSLFSQNHTAQTGSSNFMYALPTFSNDIEDSFYGRFKCYSDDEAFTEETGKSFADEILSNRYPYSDFIYMAMPKAATKSFIKYVIPNLGVEQSDTYDFQVSEYGYILKLQAPMIENPADTIELNITTAEIEPSETIKLEAKIPAGSDDRIIWTFKTDSNSDMLHFPANRYVEYSVNGDTVEIKGLRSGQVIVTATAYSSLGSIMPVSEVCSITIGSGFIEEDAVIWAGGSKEKKKTTLKTSLKATSVTNDKGKTKTGKLVWYASDDPIEPDFDEEKLKVSFSSGKSKSASVNAKGEVTAKKSGEVFVYACDTGSGEYEVFLVEVLQAPSKVLLTDVPNTSDKVHILKKTVVEGGGSVKVYISAFAKTEAAEKVCTYTVRIPKSNQSKYVNISEVQEDEKGNPFFVVDAVDFDRSKSKAASVKIEVVCNESNKKGSVTIVIGNPVVGASLSSGSSSDLSKKGSSITYTLDLMTTLGDTKVTTDKVKVYVGQSYVTMESEKKVSFDRGATVKAKYDAKTGRLTLTASKDAGIPAVIAVAATNNTLKRTTLITLAKVDGMGNVTICSE